MKLQYQLSARLADICKLFGVTRQAYYKQRQHQDRQLLHQEIVLQMVEHLRKQPQWKRTGTDVLHRVLKPDFQKLGIKMGRVALNELLFEHGLQVRKRRPKARTTDSYHRYSKYPNMIKDRVLDRPNEVWVSDITYLDLTTRFAYLFLITDAYSRKIVGYCLQLTLSAAGAVNALQMAVEQNNIQSDNSLTHHSDRGVQYCCNEYVYMLNELNVCISMAAKGNPYENAIAERMNGIVKQMGLSDVFANFTDMMQAVEQTIDVYNNQRPHSSINYLTPAQAHTKTGTLKKNWKQKIYTVSLALRYKSNKFNWLSFCSLKYCN